MISAPAPPLTDQAISSLTLLQSSSLLPLCLLANYSTSGKIKSEVATGVNAEVPVTEVNAKQGRRFDWTPAVCSVLFVPLRVWMIRIFFVLLTTPPSSLSNLNQIGSTARFLACSTWMLAQVPCHCRSKPPELGAR